MCGAALCADVGSASEATLSARLAGADGDARIEVMVPELLIRIEEGECVAVVVMVTVGGGAGVDVG